MLNSDFYIFCKGHLIFDNTKVYLNNILFDDKFFPKL